MYLTHFIRLDIVTLEEASMTAIDGTDLLCRSQEIGNIPAQLIFLWEQLNEPYGVKDLNSHFIYANSCIS